MGQLLQTLNIPVDKSSNGVDHSFISSSSAGEISQSSPPILKSPNDTRRPALFEGLTEQ